VALGRKNLLFAGSDMGGGSAAAMCTLIGTAKLCGLDPQAYLQHDLAHIAGHPTNKIDDSLPWNVVALWSCPYPTGQAAGCGRLRMNSRGDFSCRAL
jgi:hypothetical protein